MRHQHQRVVGRQGIQLAARRQLQVGCEDGVQAASVDPLALGAMGHFLAQGLPDLGIGAVAKAREINGTGKHRGNGGMLMGADKPGHQRTALQVHHLGGGPAQGHHGVITAHRGDHTIPHGQGLRHRVLRIHGQHRATVKNHIRLCAAAARQPQHGGAQRQSANRLDAGSGHQNGSWVWRAILGAGLVLRHPSAVPGTRPGAVLTKLQTFLPLPSVEWS